MPARGTAERLTLLVEYSEGILARLGRQIELYNDAEHRPPFLQAKEMDVVIKSVIKKFPTIEQPKQGQQSPMFLQREAIQNQLGDAYFLLVDMHEFHVAVSELLTNLSEMQFTFNAGLVIQLTQQFFMLLCNYTSSIELLSRFADRKTVAGCFQCSYEMLQGVGEPGYAAVARFLCEFDTPFRQLPVFFQPHKKLLVDAVMTLKPIFDVRYLTPSMLRKDSPYNISKAPHLMGVPTPVTELAAELIPIDNLVQWICMTFCLVPDTLIGNEAGVEMLSRALSDGYMLPLHRAHTLNIFKTLEISLGTSSGKELKKVTKALMSVADAVNSGAGQFHAERRQFLRGALRELHLLVSDKPGLIGPKCSTLFAALSFVRGEIMWLFRHKYASEKLSAKKKMDSGWLDDPALAELMFWASMLRRDIMDNSAMVQRYFVEFMDLDAKELHSIMSQGNFADYEQKIFSSFYEIADKCSGEISVPAGKLGGLRLDLRRLSSAMCEYSSTSKVNLDKDKGLALHLSVIHFHSSLVDSIDASVMMYSSLDKLVFYHDEYIKMFEATIKSGTQDNYLVAFAEYCVTFPLAANKDVPSDAVFINNEAANVAHHVLTRIAQQAVGLVNHVAKAMSGIDSKVLPAEAVEALAVRMEAKGKSSKRQVAAVDQNRPGSESQSLGDATVRGLRELQEHLADVCWTLNSFPAITIGHIRLAPQEYMTELMEQSFAQALVGMLQGPRDNVPARPSVVLQSVTTYMGVLRHVEGSINIDIISLFQEGLLQQTLFKVGGRGMTLATKFIQFYLNMILKMVPAGGVVVSTSRKALCHLGPVQGDLGFKAEEYTDILELRALCSLIGAFGMKQLSDNLMTAVSQAAIEMKRIVTENKTELDIIRCKTHLPKQCAMAFSRIREMNDFIYHSKVVGAVLSFRQLLADASQSVFSKRIPYIFQNIQDWHSHVNTGAALNSLAFAAGIKSRADPFLIQTFKPLCTNPEDDYSTWSLYMVMSACALKQLAYDPTTVFSPVYDAHTNNAHCVAQSVMEISAAVFTLTAVSPEVVEATITDAQTQFLRVASILLIRLGSEGPSKTDKEGPLSRNAVYVILDRLTKASPFLSADVLEEHFPYSLIRTSLHECYRTLDGR